MNTNDFKLDLVSVSKTSASGANTRVTSISLCTPGCKTGWLMGCNLKTASCHCSVHVSK
ncbi:MAG: gallidermin/nisin family lantibiotic [Streptococcaceae bacterium]|nr:gallidermin/nisin family lantibiotic [Streptococcaceae bacterium]